VEKLATVNEDIHYHQKANRAASKELAEKIKVLSKVYQYI
jgi:hypothetical protein